MVPPAHMKLLYAKAAAHNKQCLFVEFPTGMHMDTWLSGGDHYWRTVQDFIDQHVSKKKNEESNPRSNGNIWSGLCSSDSVFRTWSLILD